jgi:hypothetical protein
MRTHFFLYIAEKTEIFLTAPFSVLQQYQNTFTVFLFSKNILVQRAPEDNGAL